jgi:hypothetical protein
MKWVLKVIPSLAVFGLLFLSVAILAMAFTDVAMVPFVSGVSPRLNSKKQRARHGGAAFKNVPP